MDNLNLISAIRKRILNQKTSETNHNQNEIKGPKVNKMSGHNQQPKRVVFILIAENNAWTQSHYKRSSVSKTSLIIILSQTDRKSQ